MIDFTNISPSFLTKKEVLCHTTPEAIFYHYFGRYKLGKCYSSPLRKDKDPSFGFYYNKSGELTTNDLTTLGIGFPAQLTNFETTTGTAINDQNQATVTLTARTTVQALPLDSLVVIPV